MCLDGVAVVQTIHTQGACLDHRGYVTITDCWKYPRITWYSVVKFSVSLLRFCYNTGYCIKCYFRAILFFAQLYLHRVSHQTQSGIICSTSIMIIIQREMLRVEFTTYF